MTALAPGEHTRLPYLHHGSNSLRVDRGARTEVLWSNRPIAARDEQAELLFETTGDAL